MLSYLVVLIELLVVSIGANLFQFFFQKNALARLNATRELLKQERQAALFGQAAPPPVTEDSNGLAPSYLAYLKRQLENAFSHKHIDLATLNAQLDEIDRAKLLSLIRYNILQAEWDAIHHPDSPNEAWNRLFESLAPLLERIKAPPQIDSAQLKDYQTAYDELNKNVEFYRQRIENLEQFRRMYFELEESFLALHSENEQLSQDMLDSVVDKAERAKLKIALEQYKFNNEKLICKLRQQQTVISAAQREVHTSLPSNKREREDLLFLANPQYALAKHEINLLERVDSEQRALVKKLKAYAKEMQSKENLEKLVAEQEKEILRFEATLKNSKNCIKTLEMSLEDASIRIHEYELENNKLRAKVKDVAYMETTIMQFSRDSAQMMDCIQTLEASLRELSEDKETRQHKIASLEQALQKKEQEANKLRNELVTLEEMLVKQSRQRLPKV